MVDSSERPDYCKVAALIRKESHPSPFGTFPGGSD